MRAFHRIIASTAAALTAGTVVWITAGAARADDWKLVWVDEFNQPGAPDSQKWNYEEGYIRNNEKQYYTRDRRENARVEDGVLIIEARKERYEIPTDGARRKGRQYADYTSASLITRGKASWTYGRIQVRAKLPQGRGMWPAIWMLGTIRGDVGWPECGEIDIMEYVGYRPHTIHANIHTKRYNHVLGTGKGSKIRIEKPYEDFHLYWIQWTPEKIDFFVDDQKYFTYENEGTGNAAWPYDKPHYLILNIAVGGSWGGQKGIDDEIFPQQMQIDYVRVYQRASATNAER